MPPSPVNPSARNDALYRSTVQEAASAGGLMMGKLVAGARQILQTREAASRELRERDALADSTRLLRSHEPALSQRYPKALLQVFADPELTRKAVARPAADVQFGELELMDEAQVLTSVALARIQQNVMLAAEASLAELTPLICTTLGLGRVQPERNPLRPELFIHALKEVIAQTGVPNAIQLDWLGAMSATLSSELKVLYTKLGAQLLAQGVVPAGYTVTQTPISSSHGVGRGVAQDILPSGSFPSAKHPASAGGGAEPAAQASVRLRSKDEGLLTLDRLRRLLAGELDAQAPSSRAEQFAEQFAQRFEGGSAPLPPVTDFDATVPAALEALNDMQQVERVVQSLEQRRSAGPGSAAAVSSGTVESQRQAIRRSAKSVAQALSLEVVTLMVDNIAHDPRLLDPVQHVIRNLEPALLRLSLADPRFFTDKAHPARQLLQELTHRSLAFDSVDSPGFGGFLKELEAAVNPLANLDIQDDEPFERILVGLQDAWAQAARQKERAREQAVFALQHAEARNLLAEKIARSIEEHPDASKVPAVVVDFLCGPWAQVVAQARIKGGTNSQMADKYQALISALLWSAHPDLARQNVTKLTRLVPRLLSTLREGLDSIDYPATRTSAFFEALMAIHQLAFRGQRATTDTSAPRTGAAGEGAVAALRARFVEDGDPWVAPEEAKTSNFVDISDDIPAEGAGGAPSGPPSEPLVVNLHEALNDLPLGSWIELKVNGQWKRTQLTWFSPHGTLFLFTDSVGATQSMTRRSCDRLIATGQLRLISGQPVVDDALDAVAQAAMRNSVDGTQ